jgi:hypothetical protein
MNAPRKIILAMMLLVIGLSCTKDDGYVENPNEQGLTPCPADSYCEYSYADNSEFSDANDQVGKGNARVFTSVIQSCRLVYIRTPMGGNDFYIDNTAIQKDVVKVKNNTTICFTPDLKFKVTGGFSKGKKLKDLLGKEKWLLETRLFIAVEDINYKDTLYVKQYYYPKAPNN